MDEKPETDLHALWQGQPVEPKRFSPDEIRDQAARFQRTVRLRNVREYVAAAVVIVLFGAYAWRASTWLGKAGPALVVIGTLYIVRELHTRAASLPVPAAESCLQFHRAELARQRDMLRSVWRWYLGPLVPGLVVMFVDRFVEASSRGGAAIAAALGSVLVTAVVFLGIGWLNAFGARKIQREIDALELDATAATKR